MVYTGNICDYGVKNVNTLQYFLKSCRLCAQPCQNTRSQKCSWEVRMRWERIHRPARGEGALSPTGRVAPRLLTPAGRGARDTPVWAGGRDALNAQVLPSCAQLGQGTRHCAGTGDAPPAGSAHQSSHHHPAPATVKHSKCFWAGFCQ